MLTTARGVRNAVGQVRWLAAGREESNGAFKSADSFMAELAAMGFAPAEIKKICTKHPDMLSSKWTPEARRQKWELLKKMDQDAKPGATAKQSSEE